MGNWGSHQTGSKIRLTSNSTHTIPSPTTFQEKNCVVAGLLDHIEEVIMKGLSSASTLTD